jgi:hypothetical protein
MATLANFNLLANIPLLIFLFLSNVSSIHAQQMPLPDPTGPRTTAIPILIMMSLIMIGLIFTFLGKRIIKILITILGFFLFIFICLWISNACTDLSKLSVGQKIGIIIGSIVVGVLGAVLSWYLYKVGVCVLGFFIGFQVGGFLIQNLVQSRLTLTIIMVVCGIIFATLAIFLNHIVIVLFSSFVGAELVFVGIDVVANKGLLDLIGVTGNRKAAEMNASIWCMLIAGVVLGCIGSFVQFRALERYRNWRNYKRLDLKGGEQERLV